MHALRDLRARARAAARRAGGLTAAALALAALAASPRPAAAGAFRPSPSTRSAYSESWTFIADLEGGTYVHATLSLTNLGPGGLKGICRATVVSPGAPIWKASTRVGRDEIRFAPGTSERLEIARCSASAAEAGPTRLEVKLDEGTLTLEYAGAPLRRPPHDAVVVVGADLFRNDALLFRAPVRAALAPSGAAPRVLRGLGYADHSRSTVTPRELARRWVRFRGLAPGAGLLLLGREGHDGRFAPLWSCTGTDGASCREYVSFDVTRSGDAKAPRFEVTIAGERAGARITSGEVLLRDAPVEELGVLGKLVAPFVGSPVTYTCRARAEEAGRPPVDGILEVELADE